MMMPTFRLWLALAGVFGMTGVAAGAYGAHALGGDAEIRRIFDTGVLYQLIHALALLGTAWLAAAPSPLGRALPAIAGGAFTLGIVLFSGTLYGLALSGTVFVRGAAPIGGGLLMLGWLLLSAAAIRGGGRRPQP